MSLTNIKYGILRTMVLKKNHRSRKGASATKFIFALTFLLLVGLSVRVWYLNGQNKLVASIGQTASARVMIDPLDQSQFTWRSLRDQDNDFDVKYPREIFEKTAKQITSPLTNKESLRAVGLVRLIPVESCNLVDSSERCTSTTTNIAVDFFTVARNFNDVFKDLQKKYTQDMSVVTVNGHQGVRFLVKANAWEGSIYTVFPINNIKTLFIRRSYVNEDYNQVYQKNPEFIKYSDQTKLFNLIMSTFAFRPTI